MASIEETTAPTELPISVSDAKDHARIDETAEDRLIELMIGAATTYVQNVTGRQLVSATYAARWDRFPRVIKLPRFPVSSVTSISYNDLSGNAQTLSSSLYTTDLNIQPARIIPEFGETWPNTQGHINDVTVTFVAGYGNAVLVPDKFKLAVQEMTAHLYEYRGVVVEKALSSIPIGFEALLWDERVFYGNM